MDHGLGGVLADANEMGNLGLTGKEENAIVTFLKTRTDGYDLSKEAAELDGEAVILQHALFQNFPNPFHLTTTIAFELAEKGFTTLLESSTALESNEFSRKKG